MSVLIFGILNIGYGLLKLGMILLNVAMSHMSSMKANPVADYMKSDPTMVAWTKFGTVSGAILGVALIALGIGLLLMKNWARLGSIVYSIIDIFMVVIGSIVVWPVMQRAMEQLPKNVPQGMVQGIAMVSMVVGIIFTLAYPALLLFFMTRTNVIEACQPEQLAAPGTESV